MFCFPKSFLPFFNWGTSAFSLAASHLAHSQKQKEILTYAEESPIDPGRGDGIGQRGFRGYPDPALHS